MLFFDVFWFGLELACTFRISDRVGYFLMATCIALVIRGAGVSDAKAGSCSWCRHMLRAVAAPPLSSPCPHDTILQCPSPAATIMYFQPLFVSN